MQTKVDIAIIGNGIVACALAEALGNSGKTIAIIGPTDRPDSASLAAAAMLNSYAELGEGSLDHEIQRYKFSKSCEATQLWPGYLKSLSEQSGVEISLIEKTSLVKTGEGSSSHFNAVKNALEAHGQKYFEKEDHLILENEAAVQPELVFKAFDKILSDHDQIVNVQGYVYKLEIESATKRIYTHSGDQIQAQQIVLASGVHVNELCSKTKGLEKVLQIFYGRGLSAHLRCPNHGIEWTHRTCHDGAHCGVYLIPYNEDQLFIGATSELMQSAEERNKRMELNYLLDKAKQSLCPNLKSAEVEKVLLGYRPTTADAFPLFGQTSVEGVWVASGTKRDGFHLAPVISQELSKAILQNGVPFSGKFLPERDLYSYMDPSKMFEKAQVYFASDDTIVAERWKKIINNYPSLQNASIEPELWHLFEMGWVKI